MSKAYIPFAWGFWQRKGLYWFQPIAEWLDQRATFGPSPAYRCPWYWGSHGCDRRQGHRGDHRCGIHWAWLQGEGFL